MNTRLAKCGHSVPTHGGKQRNACDSCRQDAGATPQTWRIKCRGCGAQAVVGHQSQCYCSTDCRVATLAAARAAELAARRAGKRCLTCDADLALRRAQKYCSKRCSDVARGNVRAVPLARTVCVLAECGIEFQPKQVAQRTCCEAHGKKLWNREHPEPWNDRKRDNYHRRKALRKGSSTGRPVRLADIRERDKNRCHLCSEKVSAKPYPHPLSASLDHVIPLSRGGIHDPDNVRLAHLRCNVEKGADGGNEQLLLIG